jgi:hypothetical protein
MGGSGGFRRLGEVRPTDLDLPAARARALLLQDAWKRLAGEAIVERTGKVEVRRGVLEVRCLDRAWRGALLAVLPRLARALASECPDLGLASWRLRVEGEPGSGESAPILSLVDAKPVARPDASRSRRAQPGDEDPVSSPAERLEAVKERYLEVRKPPRP